MPKQYMGLPLYSDLYQGLNWGQPNAVDTGQQFGAKGLGLQQPQPSPQAAPPGNPGNVGPTPTGTGPSPMGEAMFGTTQSALGTMTSLATLGLGGIPGFLGTLADMGQEAYGSDEGMTGDLAPNIGEIAAAQHGVGNDPSVGLGMSSEGTIASAQHGYGSDPNVGLGPGIGGTGAPGGSPGASPGSPGDAVGGAGMGSGTPGEGLSGGPGGGGGVCYITTATVEHMGFEDDGPELSALRWFRDNIMAKTKEGRQDIQDYYRIAPKIVEELNSKDNATRIYRGLYTKFIKRAVKEIEKREYGKAWAIYKNMVQELYSQNAAEG